MQMSQCAIAQASMPMHGEGTGACLQMHALLCISQTQLQLQGLFTARSQRSLQLDPCQGVRNPICSPQGLPYPFVAIVSDLPVMEKFVHIVVCALS